MWALWWPLTAVSYPECIQAPQPKRAYELKSTTRIFNLWSSKQHRQEEGGGGWCQRNEIAVTATNKEPFSSMLHEKARGTLTLISTKCTLSKDLHRLDSDADSAQILTFHSNPLCFPLEYQSLWPLSHGYTWISSRYWTWPAFISSHFCCLFLFLDYKLCENYLLYLSYCSVSK